MKPFARSQRAPRFLLNAIHLNPAVGRKLSLGMH